VAGNHSQDFEGQEIAIRNRTTIVYLVDSAGVNIPYQDGIFPGQYGAGRIFLYNSLMRRRLRVPQFAAVMGPCIAGGAYLPALSDLIIMVEKTSFMAWAVRTRQRRDRPGDRLRIAGWREAAHCH